MSKYNVGGTFLMGLYADGIEANSENEAIQKFKEMNIYPAIFQGRDSWNEESRVSEKTFWIHWGNLSWFKVY